MNKKKINKFLVIQCVIIIFSYQLLLIWSRFSNEILKKDDVLLLVSSFQNDTKSENENEKKFLLISQKRMKMKKMERKIFMPFLFNQKESHIFWFCNILFVRGLLWIAFLTFFFCYEMGERETGCPWTFVVGFWGFRGPRLESFPSKKMLDRKTPWLIVPF